MSGWPGEFRRKRKHTEMSKTTKDLSIKFFLARERQMRIT